MARNNKFTDKDTARGAFAETAKDTAAGKERSSRSRNRRGRGRRNADRDTALKSTSQFTKYLVSPNCASIGSFGNKTTTPGQDNGLADFNRIRTTTNITPGAEDFDNATILIPEGATRAASAMRIDILPYFGALGADEASINNPIMLAALNLKQYLDTSFGTNTNYTAADLIHYLMAIAAVFPMIAEVKRDLKLTYTYVVNQYPQFIPKGLFALLEISDENHDYQEGEGAAYTAKNLRPLIDQLNQLIIAFNRLPLPPELSVLGVNDDLFDCIYADSEDITTAQLYIFKNQAMWTYEEEGITAENGAALVPRTLTTANGWGSDDGMTIQERLTLIEEQITKLSALRSDSNSMLQNLFNAYGSKNLIEIPLLDVNALEQVEIRYDANVLTMIENMLVTDVVATEVSYIVADAETSTINGHIFVHSPEAGSLQAAQLVDVPLQFHKPASDVTPEDIGWALRLHPSFRTYRKFPAWTINHPEGEILSKITCDDYVGFALCRGIVAVKMTSLGLISQRFRTTGLEVDDAFPSMMMDFSTYPIFVTATSYIDGRMLKVSLTNYYARRDVEVAYRLDDIRMHWKYLTQDLWAGNVVRNVLGTRDR